MEVSLRDGFEIVFSGTCFILHLCYSVTSAPPRRTAVEPVRCVGLRVWGAMSMGSVRGFQTIRTRMRVSGAREMSATCSVWKVMRL